MTNSDLSTSFFLQMAAIIATCRVVGWIGRRWLGQPQVVGEMIAEFPCSGEVNTDLESVEQAKAILAKVEEKYGAMGGTIDRIDGLSIEFADWRFNLRSSNTEPVIRLNVETRGDHEMMVAKTQELKRMIEGKA